MVQGGGEGGRGPRRAAGAGGREAAPGEPLLQTAPCLGSVPPCASAGCRLD